MNIDTTPYQEFAKERLGFEFHNIDLLVAALTHRSYINEHRLTHTEHNERLEFLGDAVLELVVSDFLYHNYYKPEGIMTSWRSALVRTEANCASGLELGYEPLIRLSKGEQAGTQRAHSVIIADCYEAVIGAIYEDQGFETASRVIYEHTLDKMDQILEEESWRDPKSYFQELAQKNDGTTPIYRTLSEDGPDHDRTFIVGAYVDGILRGQGSGHSKQDAQAAAAYEAIKYYKALNVTLDEDEHLSFTPDTYKITPDTPKRY